MSRLILCFALAISLILLVGCTEREKPSEKTEAKAATTTRLSSTREEKETPPVETEEIPPTKEPAESEPSESEEALTPPETCTGVPLVTTTPPETDRPETEEPAGSVELPDHNWN